MTNARSLTEPIRRGRRHATTADATKQNERPDVRPLEDLGARIRDRLSPRRTTDRRPARSQSRDQRSTTLTRRRDSPTGLRGAGFRLPWPAPFEFRIRCIMSTRGTRSPVFCGVRAFRSGIPVPSPRRSRFVCGGLRGALSEVGWLVAVEHRMPRRRSRTGWLVAVEDDARHGMHEVSDRAGDHDGV